MPVVLHGILAAALPEREGQRILAAGMDGLPRHEGDLPAPGQRIVLLDQADRHGLAAHAVKGLDGNGAGAGMAHMTTIVLAMMMRDCLIST